MALSQFFMPSNNLLGAGALDEAVRATSAGQGIDMFALPTSRSFGLNLKLNF